MSSITNFNHFCNETERALSAGAAFPIIGTVPAVCKLVLGTIQAITALALGILSTPFRFCSDNAAAFNDHCWSHAVHGLGNMAASLAEAIPLLGTFLILNRTVGMLNDNPEHQDKYIPYPDLIARDMAKVGGVAKQHMYDTTAPSDLSPTRFRACIGVNVVSQPEIIFG